MLIPVEFESAVVALNADGKLLLALFDALALPSGERVCIGMWVCSVDSGRELMKSLGSALNDV